MPVTLPSLKPLRRFILDNCDIKRHRMGCIAFNRKGYVISMSCNRRGSGHVSEYSFHCEEMALNKAKHYRSHNPKEKIYLLVVRIRSRTDWGLAKPCEGCYQLCKEAGVAGIFYTTVDGIRSL